MPFEPLLQTPGVPTNWDLITHVRLVRGLRPDSEHALKRWEILKELAKLQPERAFALPEVLAALDPVRDLPSGREASIKQDLRNWSNPRDHGNNSQDKGWLELGRLT
ncbi:MULTISPECIES: hypothetical protein [Sphingobium]|uniref:Uncharacterized protein n=1 Tax=Sphingobium fuliginis (strain ATCC 27551) TaxID=336203 RepID=A0A292ZIP5_SPHSA|nr:MULTISPECIES: hypothetical protein [Sphingobium]GAY22665.1 hypothetical protein SFOMI_3226 [Sphingobium fuliginis]